MPLVNSKGGSILFGIDDDKSVVGVESEKGELELITTAAKFYCEPEIDFDTDIMLLKRKDIVVVNIEESRTKPHRLVTDDESGEQKFMSVLTTKAFLLQRRL